MPRPLLRWCPPFSGDTPISVVALTHPSTPLLQPGSLLFPITSLSSFLPSLVNPSYGIVLNCFSSAFFPPLHPHIPFHLLYSMTTFTRCTLPTSSILFLLFLPLPPPFHPLPLFLSGLSILFFCAERGWPYMVSKPYGIMSSFQSAGPKTAIPKLYYVVTNAKNFEDVTNLLSLFFRCGFVTVCLPV